MGSPSPSSTKVAKLRGTRGFHVPPCRKHPKCGKFGVSMSRRDGNRPRCSKLWCTSSLQPHVKRKARSVKRMKVSSLVKDLAKDQRLESLLELVHHGLSKVERRTECQGMKHRRNKVQRGGRTRLVLGGYYCQGSRASQ